MSFSEFFANQARKPSGFFGRFIMSSIFNIGNSFLNKLTLEALSINSDDRVLDIGCGTGMLVRNIAKSTDADYIEGVDFSNAMVSLAQKKNRSFIKNGRVKIVEGDFNTIPYQNSSFSKICSVNTIYFWKEPEITTKKIAGLLNPGGKLLISFEDIYQLEKRDLNKDVFQLYTTEQVKDLLTECGFNDDVRIITQNQGDLKFHCVVGTKA